MNHKYAPCLANISVFLSNLDRTLKSPDPNSCTSGTGRTLLTGTHLYFFWYTTFTDKTHSNSSSGGNFQSSLVVCSLAGSSLALFICCNNVFLVMKHWGASSGHNGQTQQRSVSSMDSMLVHTLIPAAVTIMTLFVQGNNTGGCARRAPSYCPHTAAA